MKKSADTLAAMAVTWRRDAIDRTDSRNGFNDCQRKAEKLYETFERAEKYVDRMNEKYKYVDRLNEKYMKLFANKKHKKRTANKKHNK